MEFYEVIKQRRSIRGYVSQPVEEEKLHRIWEAVRLAPTACNLQPFRLLVVSSPEKKAAVCQCYPQEWLGQAPLIVIVLGNRNSAWKRLDGSSIHDVDAAIVMEHLVLAATAEGLGTCWICAFDQGRLHDCLGLDAEWEPVAMTPLGYSTKQPRELEHKQLDELIEVI